MNIKIKLLRASGLALLVLAFFVSAPVSADSSQALGKANTFVILSSTFSNTVSGTTLNGDLGYTTPPATGPTVNGTTHVADSIYNQAGIDQGNALSALNSRPCTFNFAPGAVDLASDTTHGTVGVYTPGVYCITGAGSIGGGGTITLTGAGTYIFRMDGALSTSVNSNVIASGASACDVWWSPTAATTLGANSTFLGSDIDASGITVGSTVTWLGQALAFGNTVSTNVDTITTPTCPASRAGSPALSSATPTLPNTGGADVRDMSVVGTTTLLVIALIVVLYRQTQMSRKLDR